MRLKLTNSFVWRDAVLFVISGLLVFIYISTAGTGFPLDDSWIHQVYGRNLASYGEWAFIPGIPSAASTSPLYTVLLAIGYKVGISYRIWTHLLGILALSITAMIGLRLSEKLTPKRPSAAWITGLAIILTWHLLWAAASGMETMLFAMFTLVLIYAVPHDVNRVTGRNGTIFGAMSALTTMTRPEGAALAGICGMVVLIVYQKRSLAWCIAAFSGFLLVIAPYLVLNLNLTGSLLPNTASAKQAEYAPLLEKSYLSRFFSMLMPVLVGGQILLLPGAISFGYNTLVQRHSNWLIHLIPILWIFALVGLYAARLPAAYQHGRYVIPLLPSLILIGVVGSYEIIQKGKRSAVGRVLSRSLVIAAGITFVYFGLVLGPAVYSKDVQIINEEMVNPAQWIATNLPQDELLAVHDIGAVGYFAPRPILDLAGLVTEEVIPIIRDGEALWELMQAKNAKYLMAFEDQIPGQNPADLRLCPVYESGGQAALNAGGTKMTVYRISFDGCST